MDGDGFAIFFAPQQRDPELPVFFNVDGRVSSVKDYFYDAGVCTIVELNESIQACNLGVWPRLDKVSGCPAELSART